MYVAEGGIGIEFRRVRGKRAAADIAGAYTAVSGSISVAGGGKVATLQNANGVVLQLRGRQVGFEASLALSGLTVSVD